MRAERPRGQIAIGFLTIIALALVLVTMTVNVGQQAQVRVETSNAADAAALAGASWIASGMNEAAMVVAKLNEAVMMVQAIYLVPFCPGAEQRSYAENLWYSLETHPFAWDPVLFGPADRRRGPAPYFREVAEDAMWAAWYVGGREWYTSAVNNMMLRYGTSPMFICPPGADLATCLSGHSNYGDLRQAIKDEQESLLHHPKTTPEGTTTILQWNNGEDFDDPMNLTHTAPFNLEYPNAPSLTLAAETGSYLQYEPAQEMVVDGVPHPVFTCTFEGWGIRTGYSGVPDPEVPFALMPDDLLDYSVNPLAMVEEPLMFLGPMGSNWRKGWDVPWRADPLAHPEAPSTADPYVPSIDHLDVGYCQQPDGSPQYVCGVGARQTALAIDVGSPTFNDGVGHVGVAIAHEVETAVGEGESNPWFGLDNPVPNLALRFGTVASRARAEFQPPDFSPAEVYGLPFAPATAELVEAN